MYSDHKQDKTTNYFWDKMNNLLKMERTTVLILLWLIVVIVGFYIVIQEARAIQINTRNWIIYIQSLFNRFRISQYKMVKQETEKTK